MWETLKLTPSPFTFILHNSPTIFMPLKYFCLLWDTYLAKNDVLKIACILLLRYWWKLRWGFLQFLDIQLHLLHVNLHVITSCIKIEVLCMKWDIARDVSRDISRYPESLAVALLYQILTSYSMFCFLPYLKPSGVRMLVE